MKSPKISVITVCRNSGSTIRSTLESVAGQTYRHVEHVVVDGCSTDDTLAVVRAWQDHAVRLISEPDEGIYHAMNKGLAMATGDIVGFLNADDVYANDSVLEQIAAVFNDPTTETCYADLVYVRKDDLNSVVRYWKSSSFKQGAFALGWCPAHPTFYARNSVFERLGQFDQSYRLAADADLMIRFLELGHASSVYIPQVWVKMRVGGQTNLSFGNIVKQNREILSSLERHGVPVSPARFVVSKILNRIVQRWARTHAG